MLSKIVLALAAIGSAYAVEEPFNLLNLGDAMKHVEATLPDLFSKTLRRSWVLISEFDYEDPSMDILNLAYPSAIASYFVTIVPEDSTYVFTGTFPTGEGVYQSNLIAYTFDGDVDSNIEPLFDHTSEGEVSMTVTNSGDQPMWVLQRFYLDPDMYDRAHMVSLLFNVSKVTTNFGTLDVPVMSEFARDIFSRALTLPFRYLIKQNAPFSYSETPFGFMLPASTKSLFPDSSHVYLFSNPAGQQVAHITGTFVPNATLVYMDFIVVNQNTTATESGLPFFAFVEEDGSYNVSIAAADYDGEVNDNCLRWKTRNEFPLVLARYITYDYDVVDFSGPRSPDDSAVIFGDVYPTINF